MAAKIVGVVFVEDEEDEEVITVDYEEQVLFIEYGETKLAFDAKEFLDAVFSAIFEEVQEE